MLDARRRQQSWTLFRGFVAFYLGKARAMQRGVETLPAEPEDLGRRGAIVGGVGERRLDAEPLDQVGTLAHDVLERHAADQLGELFDRAGQVALRRRQIAQPPRDDAEG